MITFKRHTLLSLYFSLAVLFFVFVFLVKSFQPLYYLLWVIGVGGYVYRNQTQVAAGLKSIPLSPFAKYLSIGIIAILVEEVFASTAMHLMRYLSEGAFTTFISDVMQFWMVNLLALPGMLLAWYVIIRRYQYSQSEIFWLAGLFGLFSEKIYLHVVAYPLFGWALVVPTIFTYGLLVLLPTLSLPGVASKKGNSVVRYTIALILPFLFSIPFVGILSVIHSTSPELFPPFGFFEN